MRGKIFEEERVLCHSLFSNQQKLKGGVVIRFILSLKGTKEYSLINLSRKEDLRERNQIKQVVREEVANL